MTGILGCNQTLSYVSAGVIFCALFLLPLILLELKRRKDSNK